MTIVGTRPEIIKLSRVIPLLDQHMDHILVHTGQNYDYELNEIFFSQMRIRKPDFFLEAAGNTAAQTISGVISGADLLFENEKPDALLLYGDTNSCLSAISAKKRKIPIFHMEAGNRSFDQRVPEESNRKIVDHLSDINMTITEHARRYLLAEGIRPETIIKVGSSMKEVLTHYRPDILNSRILEELELKKNEYFVVSIHREENVDSDERLREILQTLGAVAKRYDRTLIVSTHPRTRKKLETLEDAHRDEKLRFLKPLGFFDYIHLQKYAYCTLSDSGTITEEASLLQFPAVTLRQAHERPEGMDEGTLIMSGLRREEVLSAIEAAVSAFESNPSPYRIVPDYEADGLSWKVLKIILSYTHYVNRTVWHK
ncbi:UDP-N-acetylglucosamine 2-epimerase (non-hydrolyzing) [Saccharibacillus sp. CPCC 101409]|uniref:non-hydrolyzing UDP-N-acetylglucosamine 2-epimerase n=1 Tax=Saccharibacillus sp. CPCC 101409 TaxID=3058041 RepID=UPI002670E717|nr:UDP-N-acetylglucosamine 2-epimerase (non-hydrolyzing) [Saccharibacillus sp. CPCC 101409]MDO3412019.1 UDP-N-acetylglucosamine 2-epimerase (non-hydrolyzing) [Saccharibacillus sp. CPCC 101409]